MPEVIVQTPEECTAPGYMDGPLTTGGPAEGWRCERGPHRPFVRHAWGGGPGHWRVGWPVGEAEPIIPPVNTADVTLAGSECRLPGYHDGPNRYGGADTFYCERREHAPSEPHGWTPSSGSMVTWPVGAAPARRYPVPAEDPTPTCDICARTEDDAPGGLDGDWNGETGCHLTCERGDRFTTYTTYAATTGLPLTLNSAFVSRAGRRRTLTLPATPVTRGPERPRERCFADLPGNTLNQTCNRLLGHQKAHGWSAGREAVMVAVAAREAGVTA